MQLPTWHDLYIDFYNFKVCGDHPVYWGRDATLWQRPFGKVQLTDSPVILARWSEIADPFYRTVKEWEAAHDSWLLYVYDNVENRYLLLSVFGPNAHKHPKFQAYVLDLRVETVDPWLRGEIECFEPPEDYEP
ncbi:hypothetical protein [Pseudomonas sp. R5(2019)]|uniref:hypothetical protein n=1 Tax=Pseudomonas sp. R5(2019) TaxID=2697566 RepID=UPI00141281EA|nr:hypothetical protein [Pseudomonas sp. R5(2019)]NBA94885.1 hypothetical protein [Pseudomonas sp. R5(2019)]